MDTSAIRKFRYHKSKLLFFLFGNALITTVFLFFSLDSYVTKDPRLIVDLIVLFLSMAANITMLYRLTVYRGHVVTISPDGFHDLRVSAAMIPWRAIDTISACSSRGITVGIELTIRPEVKNEIRVTRIARLRSRRGSLFIDSKTLDVSHSQLLSYINAYAAAAKHSRLGPVR
jgi:hypothetical protein